jgi:hypothetical protein
MRFACRKPLFALRYQVSDRVHTLISRFHHVRQLSCSGALLEVTSDK